MDELLARIRATFVLIGSMTNRAPKVTKRCVVAYSRAARRNYCQKKSLGGSPMI